MDLKTKAVFLFFLLFSTSVFSFSDIEERMREVEKKLDSNAFSYDINLRARVAESLAQQDMLLEQVKGIELRLNSLEKAAYGASKNGGVSDAFLSQELEKLREEYRLLYQNAQATHHEVLGAYNQTKSDTVASFQSTLKTTSDMVYWVLGIFAGVTGLLSIFATVYGISSNRKLNKISKVSSETKSESERISTLYAKMKEEVEGNIESIKVTQEELMSIHDLIDLRENYQKLVDEDFSSKSATRRCLDDAKDTYNDLLELNCDNSTNIHRANISYLASIIGVMLHVLGEYEEAHIFFTKAVNFNVRNRPDRFYNLACGAARLYEKSTEEKYINEVIMCIEKLSPNQDMKDKLMEDPDLEKIKIIVEKKLR